MVTPSDEATTYEDKMRLAVEAKKSGRGAKIYCNIFPGLFGILILEYPREVRILV